jgi:dipeptidyl-peptidase-2
MEIVWNFIRNNLNTSYQGSSWSWQKCTEFGWFKSVENTAPWFPPVPVSFVRDMYCGTYGPQYSPKDIEINNYYGDRNIADIGNILFTQGEVDPWHNMGIYEDLSPSMQVMKYYGGHCLPFRYPESTDTPDIQLARFRMGQFIGDIGSLYACQN